MPKKFSEFLEDLIKKSGFEKKEIASHLEITGSYISGLTTGRNPPPPLDLLRKLAKALNLTEKEEAELLYLAKGEAFDPPPLDSTFKIFFKIEWLQLPGFLLSPFYRHPGY